MLRSSTLCVGCCWKWMWSSRHCELMGAVARRLLGWLLFFSFIHEFFIIIPLHKHSHVRYGHCASCEQWHTQYTGETTTTTMSAAAAAAAGLYLSQYSTSTILNSSLIHWRFVCLNFIRIRFQCLLCTFQSSRLSIFISFKNHFIGRTDFLVIFLFFFFELFLIRRQ